jgi:hypothetical protein
MLPQDDANRLNAATFAAHAARHAAHRPGHPPALVEHLAQLAPRRVLALDCVPLRAVLAPLWGDGTQRLTTRLAVRAGH